MNQPLFGRQAPGQLAIGDGAAIGDLQQQLPHRPTEGSAQGVEGRQKIRLSAGEIDIQPPLDLCQSGGLLLDMLLGEGIGGILLSVEPQAGEADLVGSNQDAAQGGVIILGMGHGVHLRA